jgi:hypothetical protein
MTVINEQTASRKPSIAPQVDTVLDRALRDPVIRSAVGVVRESACLLYHIAGLGIALVSDPQNSQPKYGTGRTRPVAPAGANVIPFPGSKCRAIVQNSNRNGS